MADPRKQLELLFEAGLSPAEAVDYLAVEEFGQSQTRWARVRGKSQPAISENVKKARMKYPYKSSQDEAPDLDEETEIKVKDINSKIVSLEHEIRGLKRDRRRILDSFEREDHETS